MQSQFPDLVLTLTAKPPVIYKDTMPGSPPRVNSVHFTLMIRNMSRSDFHSQCHGCGVIVTVTQDRREIGRGPHLESHVMRPITIRSGESENFATEVQFPNPEQVFAPGEATAEAVFTPNGDQKAILILQVKDVQ